MGIEDARRVFGLAGEAESVAAGLRQLAPRALIALTDGVLNLVDKDNKPLETYRWEKGKAYWLGANAPGEMHAEVNRTAKPIEVIVVELKKDQ